MSILSRAKNGEEEAFAMLMEEYKLPMYKTAKAILNNEDDVCDVIQDALFSIYRGLNSLKHEEYLKTWIIRIIINKCYDVISKENKNNQKIEKVQNNFESDTYSFSEKIVKLDLERALSLIDNDLRTVTVLYYYDDISVKDIADILGIPAGTVKSKLSRARDKLYEILRHEEVNTNG